MNMDLWIREQIATQNKKAMPLLSYPAVQQLFIMWTSWSIPPAKWPWGSV